MSVLAGAPPQAEPLLCLRRGSEAQSEIGPSIFRAPSLRGYRSLSRDQAHEPLAAARSERVDTSAPVTSDVRVQNNNINHRATSHYNQPQQSQNHKLQIHI